jgi:hypothetical protein
MTSALAYSSFMMNVDLGAVTLDGIIDATTRSEVA